MHSITINISNDTLLEKVTWLLEHFRNDGLEIVSKDGGGSNPLIDSISFDILLSHYETV